jgi:hypothetical protein
MTSDGIALMRRCKPLAPHPENVLATRRAQLKELVGECGWQDAFQAMLAFDKDWNTYTWIKTMSNRMSLRHELFALLQVAELEGFDGDIIALLEEAPDSKNLEEVRKFTHDRLLCLVRQQVEGGGPTIIFDVDGLAKTTAASIVPQILDLRRVEFLSALRCVGADDDFIGHTDRTVLSILWRTAYGFEILKTMDDLSADEIWHHAKPAVVKLRTKLTEQGDSDLDYEAVHLSPLLEEQVAWHLVPHSQYWFQLLELFTIGYIDEVKLLDTLIDRVKGEKLFWGLKVGDWRRVLQAFNLAVGEIEDAKTLVGSEVLERVINSDLPERFDATGLYVNPMQLSTEIRLRIETALGNM